MKPALVVESALDLSESALNVESALDLGIGPRLGTNPRSESYIYTEKNLRVLCFIISAKLAKITCKNGLFRVRQPSDCLIHEILRVGFFSVRSYQTLFPF